MHCANAVHHGKVSTDMWVARVLRVTMSGAIENLPIQWRRFVFVGEIVICLLVTILQLNKFGVNLVAWT